METDKKMSLARSDLLDEFELKMLFEQLDIENKFEDMIRLLLWYKRTILVHYELTNPVFDYNINRHSLSNISDVYRLDIITIINMVPEGTYRFLELLRMRLFKGENLRKVQKILMKRIYGEVLY